MAAGLGSQSHHPNGALHPEIPLGDYTHSVPSSVKHPLNSLLGCKQEGLWKARMQSQGSLSPRNLDGQKTSTFF